MDVIPSPQFLKKIARYDRKIRKRDPALSPTLVPHRAAREQGSAFAFPLSHPLCFFLRT